MDRSECVFLVLLDLSTAFDTVSHHLLFNKLQSEFGITGGALEWVQSYLINRTQSVAVGGTSSDPVVLE